MRSGKFFPALVVVLLVASGCQSGVGSFQTVRLPIDDYDRTFDVTRQVLGEFFVVERADKASGQIVTSPKTVPEPEGVVGTVLDLPGAVRRTRRIATAQVKRSDGTVRVSVKVQLQMAESVQSSPRPTYSEYDPTATGAESDVYREPEKRTGVVWKRAGSDTEMEKKLLTEIERRLKRDLPEPKSSKETE